MAINTQLEYGAYTRMVADAKAQTLVEIKFAGQDAGEVVAAFPQVSLNACDISSGRANFSGRLILTLVYVGDEGKLCRIQRGAEFSHYCDDERFASAQRSVCTLSAERTQIRREGSSLVAVIVIGASIEAYDTVQRGYVSSIEGAACRREDEKLYSIVNFSGESDVEDDFDCVAEDVLIPSASVLVHDCNVRAGLAEISGELYLNLLALRDGIPVSLDRTIPFKAELACDDAVVTRRAGCRAEIKEINVNCRVSEESGKCNVEVSAALAFSGKYAEETQTPLVLDAFCKDRELDLTFTEEETRVPSDIRVYTERVGGACACTAKLDYTCAFYAAALPRAEFSRTAGGVEGSVTATLLYEQGGEIRSCEVSLPFSIALAGLREGADDISVAVCGISIRQRAEGECEAEASLKITATDGEISRVRYVSGVTEGAEKPERSAAISVYIPAAGDGLWETAKNLSENPEDVTRSNPELEFPLTGKERILIYRPKQA